MRLQSGVALLLTVGCGGPGPPEHCPAPAPTAEAAEYRRVQVAGSAQFQRATQCALNRWAQATGWRAQIVKTVPDIIVRQEKLRGRDGEWVAGDPDRIRVAPEFVDWSLQVALLTHEFGHAIGGPKHSAGGVQRPVANGGAPILIDDLETVCDRGACWWMRPEE